MPAEQIVLLGRMTLQEVVTLTGPILGIAIAISLVVNLGQVLTSLQEQTLAAVPRLFGCAAGLFFLMPWMWRHLSQFTIHLLSDFRAFVQ